MKSFSQTSGASTEPEKPVKIDKARLIGKSFIVVRFADQFSEQYGDNTKITVIIPDTEYLQGYDQFGKEIYAPQTMWGGVRMNQQLRGMDPKADFPFQCSLTKNEFGAYEFCDAGGTPVEKSDEVPF